MLFDLGDRTVQLRGDCFVADNAVVVGSVVLEHNTSIWFNAVVRGDCDLITIGEGSNVQDGAVLHTDAGVKLVVGRYVSVGHMAMLHGCTIGDNSLIGIKSVVLNHATVGNNCLIGANALITEGKIIPDGSLVLGSPGKVVRTLTDDEIHALREPATHYIENARRHRKHMKATNGTVSAVGRESPRKPPPERGN